MRRELSLYVKLVTMNYVGITLYDMLSKLCINDVTCFRYSSLKNIKNK